MIIAWPLMGIIGMFFASWMKPALPNGEWLQVQLVVHVKSNLVPRSSSRPGHEANVKSNLIPRPSSRPGHEAIVKSNLVPRPGHKAIVSGNLLPRPSSAKAGSGTRLLLTVTMS